MDKTLADKHRVPPVLSLDEPIFLEPDPRQSSELIDAQSPVFQDLNSIFNLERFRVPRRPLSLGILPDQERTLLNADFQAPKIADLPIRFPGSNFRLPREYAQCAPLIQRIANFERRINPNCYDEYYCYLTFHQGLVPKGRRQRPSPCHVDGLQGARWQPKVRCNHSYVVSTAIPTVYHAQAFELEHLDMARHNLFWEMDRQVKLAGGAHVWKPEPYELILMDCYCAHQGDEAEIDTWRTFMRVSFEVRIFDHMDNGHNPLFAYNWPVADRHIEKLGLSIWQP